MPGPDTGADPREAGGSPELPVHFLQTLLSAFRNATLGARRKGQTQSSSSRS